MTRIAIQDLKRRLAEVLRRVEAGESFEVTRHGRVVASLTPHVEDSRLHRGSRVDEQGPWTTLPSLNLQGEALRILLEDRASEDR
ncbi:MAG: type II toxin-antitoxin system prevent-host-death family antitoxin [Planctomycetes bacterium]|nr:type II toxin-antitoxin system prevent-host-death family antitoxin [Planctomycetota bacterium]